MNPKRERGHGVSTLHTVPAFAYPKGIAMIDFSKGQDIRPSDLVPGMTVTLRYVHTADNGKVFDAFVIGVVATMAHVFDDGPAEWHTVRLQGDPDEYLVGTGQVTLWPQVWDI